MRFSIDGFRRLSVEDVRSIESALRRPLASRMRPQVRDRVFERVAAREQVLLPVNDSPAHARPVFGRIGVWAALALAGLSLVILPRRAVDASPTAGTLDVRQGGTANEPVVTVRYAAPATLAGDRQLELRIVSYQNSQLVPHPVATVGLQRRDDGLFEATAPLPPGTTLMQFTVASTDGQRVDDNDSRGWEQIVRDGGKPSFDGLWVQFALHGRDDWERSFVAARTMASDYPDNPTGLRFFLGDSLRLGGAANADAVIAAFRPRVHAVAAKLADARVDASTMSEMAFLAGVARDTALLRHWRQRMIREYPRAPGTIQQRVFAVFDSVPDPRARLAALELVWRESGGQAIQLLADAFNLATSLSDSAAVIRWGDRLADFGGGYQSMVAARYIEIPNLRDKGERILRDMLGSTPRAQQAPLLLNLGKALLRDGHLVAARDTLREAVAFGRSSSAARLLGDATLALGDTIGAAREYAWAAADWRLPSALGDSLRLRVGALHDSSWTDLVQHRRADLLAKLLVTAIHRPFDANASLIDSSGRRYRVKDIVGDGVAVIAFASRYCAPSLGDLASVDSVSRLLRDADVPTLMAVEEGRDSAISTTFARWGFHGAVMFDDRAEVARAIRQSVTPQYFVVDDGKVRFVTNRAVDLAGMVAAVQQSRKK